MSFDDEERERMRREDWERMERCERLGRELEVEARERVADKHRAEERAAVVRWLRKDGGPWYRLELAEAIEAGAHHEKEEA